MLLLQLLHHLVLAWVRARLHRDVLANQIQHSLKLLKLWVLVTQIVDVTVNLEEHHELLTKLRQLLSLLKGGPDFFNVLKKDLFRYLLSRFLVVLHFFVRLGLNV